MENMINLSLSSAYLKQEIKSDFELREYKKDDLIMKEAEIPEEIFEMISGSAVAIYNDEEVGKIKEGEVFWGNQFSNRKNTNRNGKSNQEKFGQGN